MPDRAIDRAIAAVRAYQVALEQIVGREKNMPRAQSIRAGIQNVNGALAILEAAKAWGEDVEQHGLRQTLRQGAPTSAINLLNAIRGEQ